MRETRPAGAWLAAASLLQHDSVDCTGFRGLVDGACGARRANHRAPLQRLACRERFSLVSDNRETRNPICTVNRSGGYKKVSATITGCNDPPDLGWCGMHTDYLITRSGNSDCWWDSGRETSLNLVLLQDGLGCESQSRHTSLCRPVVSLHWKNASPSVSMANHQMRPRSSDCWYEAEAQRGEPRAGRGIARYFPTGLVSSVQYRAARPRRPAALPGVVTQLVYTPRLWQQEVGTPQWRARPVEAGGGRSSHAAKAADLFV